MQNIKGEEKCWTKKPAAAGLWAWSSLGFHWGFASLLLNVFISSEASSMGISLAKMDHPGMHFFYIQVDPCEAHSHTIISDMGYQQRTWKCKVRAATFRRTVADKPGNTLRPPMAEEQPGIVKRVPKQNPWPEQLQISETFKTKSQTELRGMRTGQKIRLILMRHQMGLRVVRGPR